MKTTNKNDKQTATSGFPIELTESSQLVLGMLIAEDEERRYAPVAVVASIGEARHERSAREDEALGAAAASPPARSATLCGRKPAMAATAR
jgi:hypothetical protein